MTQVITAKETAKAALDLHKKRLLGFQYTRNKCEYRYRGSEARCAIGAVLTDDTYEAICRKKLTGAYLDTLVSEKVVSVKGGDLPKLIRLQQLHDEVACDGKTPESFLAHARLLAEGE